MELSLILSLSGIVIINAINNATSLLKTIFSSKKYIKPLYITTFIDAIIFATVIKKVTEEEGFYYVLAFAVGKVIGAYIGNAVENKMALGILEVDLFFNSKKKSFAIADELRTKGYTVNTSITFGLNGTKRYRIEITILRKELPILEDILKMYECENPTLMIREINKVDGKITVSSNNLIA